eukprot:scaffold38270_cov61-Phaeocystis_antarctica.AAC.5
MQRLIAPTCSSRSSQTTHHVMPHGSPRSAATKCGAGSAADAHASHASAINSRKGRPLSMPEARRQCTVPTMVVRAISARCSAGSSFTLASRSHGTVRSRALPSSVPPGFAAAVWNCFRISPTL